MNEPRPKKVFISRTTSGLKATAEKVADILKKRGCEVIHQPDFTASRTCHRTCASSEM